MRLALFVIFTFLSLISTGQQVTYQKTYSTTTNNDCWGLTKSKSGDYITLGSQAGDIQLMNLNIFGDTTWTSVYGGINNENGHAISQAIGAGYIVAGITYSYGAGGNGDAFIVKTNGNGIPQWSNAYGGIYGDDLTAVVQGHDDNSYLFVGSTSSFGTGSSEWSVYLIRTDTNGDTLWTRNAGGAGSEYGLSAIATSDSAYLITGYTNSFGAGQNDAFLMKIDNEGNVLWFKTYGDTENDIGMDVIETNDGGYIVCGQTFSFGAGDGDVILFKTDTNGDLIWTKQFGAFGTDLARSLYQSDAGDLMLAGDTYSMSMGESDVYLMQLDSAGNFAWGRSYGGPSFEYGRALVPDDDQGFIIAGLSSSFDASLSTYMINTNGIGESGCNEQAIFPTESEPLLQVQSPNINVSNTTTQITVANPSNSQGVSINELCSEVGLEEIEQGMEISFFPNPASSKLTVVLNDKIGMLFELVIIDGKGKELLTKKFSNGTTIELGTIAPGVYIAQIIGTDGIIYSQKLVLE